MREVPANGKRKMRRTCFITVGKPLLYGVMAGIVGLSGSPASADGHGLAMHGEPKLSSDFIHLPYSNPDAPQGGAIVFGEVGTFDSLNPFIVKGTAPWRLRFHTVESLLGRNWDEPFSLYGLLAERVETPDDRSSVTFWLNPDARFSDGAAVTVDDVVASMETLAEDGQPNYRNTWENVFKVERVGDRGVRFHLEEPDREAPLILGLRPILKKADIEARAFAKTSLTPFVTSGPYIVGDLETGRRLTLARDPDYWGRDLPIRRGQNNFDRIDIEFFRDANAVWEAFTAGEIDIFTDGDPERWATGYDFPRATAGEIVQSEVRHSRPTGMWGFVFNTRKPLFADIRVREALTLAFDFEWIRRTLLAGAYERIPSYFGASDLAYSGAAAGAERALLAPSADDLPEGALEGAVAQPVSDGGGRNRRNLRAAAELMKDAGWRVEAGVRVNEAGRAFVFEILLSSGADEAVAGAFAEGLKRLGIDATIRIVDNAQYQARLVDYDFDMIVNRWGLSLSPGVEQWKYWSSEAGAAPGSRNYAGIDSPAVDAAIAALTVSETRTELLAATRALDRALTAGRFVIPFWHSPVSRIAHDAALDYPDHTPIYGDWIGFLPDVWWREPEG